MKTYSKSPSLLLSILTVLLLFTASLEWTENLGLSENLRESMLGAAIGALLALIAMFIGFCIENWGRIKLALHCKLLAVLNIDIRFSMSYLYLIEIEGKYLLVQSSNFKHQYQPVGGKYKVYEAGKEYLKELGARSDKKMSTAGIAKDDLALFVPARNALKFLDWFNSGRNREVSHWREFYEELIGCEHDVLSEKNFRHIHYSIERTVLTPIKVTPGWDNCKEILQYDVLRLIPSSAQLEELKNLLAQGESQYIRWADENLITNLGHNSHTRLLEYKIGEHAKWALQGHYSKQ